MRKFELLTIAILLIVFSAEKVYSQSRLCGHVFEANTTKALSNANVFISGTVKGTVTNKEGYFEIQGVPSESQRIIVSLLGYETVTKFLMLEQDSTYEVSIELTPRIYSTGTVNITSSKSSFERQKDLKLFKELFLGKSKFADECIIENETALNFTGSNQDSLSVKADSTLYITNNSLGYRLEVFLEKFIFDKKTNGYRKTLFTKFDEMHSSVPVIMEKWTNNRLEAYSGSLREFLISLTENSTLNKGYSLYLSDTAKGFVKLSSLETIIKKQGPNGETVLSFPGILIVKHGLESTKFELNESQITISKNGTIKEPVPFIIIGDMAQRGLARLLPEDFDTDIAKTPEMPKSAEPKKDTSFIPDVLSAASAGMNIRKFDHMKDSLQYLSLKNPKDISTRLKYAAILKISAKVSAFHEYEDIVEIDPKCSEAWYQMGKLKNSEYYETRFGKVIVEDTKDINFSKIDKSILSNRASFNGQLEISLEPKSKEILNEARQYLLRAVALNPANVDYHSELCSLYESTDEFDSLSFYAKEFTKAAPLNKDAHLFYGIAQYNLGELMTAWKEFKTALKLMSDDERKVYEYFSVIKLLEPLLGEKLRSMSYQQIENLIRSFWKSEEPLYLTEYNERLLEHYSRVLHSNLHFGVPKKNLDGWKTDRGEIFLRYGKPLSITNYSPYSGQDTYTDLQGNNYLQHTIYAQTELWQYNNMDFSFSDYWQDGNYEFTDTTFMTHRKSQVQLYSRLYAESARRTQFEKYEFLSPSKNLRGSVSTLQFKNLDEASSKATDLYVNFSIPLAQENKYSYEWGFFCFDNSFHELIMDKGFLRDFEDKNILLREDTLKSFISSRKYNCPAQDVKLAFEVVRENDSSIFTNHGKLSIKNYSKDSLMVSDIVLSPKVEFESKSETAINRNSIWVLPSPDGKFSKKDNVHIYYEIYNLAKRESGENDFEQEIIIKKKNSSSFFIGKMVGSLVRFFDSSYGRGKITTPAKVKSYGKNQQMCFMLGLDKFDSGDYEIELIVSDKVSGQKTSNKVAFELN